MRILAIALVLTTGCARRGGPGSQAEVRADCSVATDVFAWDESTGTPVVVAVASRPPSDSPVPAPCSEVPAASLSASAASARALDPGALELWGPFAPPARLAPRFGPDRAGQHFARLPPGAVMLGRRLAVRGHGGGMVPPFTLEGEAPAPLRAVACTDLAGCMVGPNQDLVVRWGDTVQGVVEATVVTSNMGGAAFACTFDRSRGEGWIRRDRLATGASRPGGNRSVEIWIEPVSVTTRDETCRNSLVIHGPGVKTRYSL